MSKIISAYVNFVDSVCIRVGRIVMYGVFFMMFVLILSFVTRPTNNIKKSVITDISKLKNEIRDIISQVSKESQTEIANIRLNVPLVNSLTNYFDSEISVSSRGLLKPLRRDSRANSCWPSGTTHPSSDCTPGVITKEQMSWCDPPTSNQNMQQGL